MSNPVSGFGYFLKGLTLITKPGIKRFVAIPLLINFIIFASLFWLLGGYVDEQIQVVSQRVLNKEYSRENYIEQF